MIAEFCSIFDLEHNEDLHSRFFTCISYINSLSLSSKERETRDERERERDVAPPSSPPKTAIHEIYSVVKSIFFLFKKREKRERERERERESAKNTYRAYLVSPPQPDLSPLPADECHEVHSGETQTHDDYFATNHRSMKEENERRREKERKKREEERREEKH